MSSPPKPTASSKLDLDDLFQDYYFNDFAQHPAPVGIFTDGAAPYDDKTPPSFSTTNSLSSMTSAIPFAPGQANPNYNPNNATPTMRAATKPTPTPSSNEPEDDFESEENDNGNDDDEDYTEKSSRRQSTRKKPAATKKPAAAKKPTKRKAKAKNNDYSDSDDDVPAKKMTEAQRVERRGRNREHAKRSRLRKKFLLESLQSQIDALEKENEKLRDVVLTEVGPDVENQNRGIKIMRDICIECGIVVPDELKDTATAGKPGQGGFTPLNVPSGFGPVNTLMEPDMRLVQALSTSQQNFAISDPTLADNPIVYVSQGFLNLTGYTLDQVLGRNCRFLQGPDTDQRAVEVIRQGVEKGVDTSICLLNYKADGTPFWNQFFVACLRDASGKVVNFVGVQCEVSKATVESQFKKRTQE